MYISFYSQPCPMEIPFSLYAKNQVKRSRCTWFKWTLQGILLQCKTSLIQKTPTPLSYQENKWLLLFRQEVSEAEVANIRYDDIGHWTGWKYWKFNRILIIKRGWYSERSVRTIIHIYKAIKLFQHYYSFSSKFLEFLSLDLLQIRFCKLILIFSLIILVMAFFFPWSSISQLSSSFI